MYVAHAQKKRNEASQLELSKCLALLENATSDNDRFTAMLEITRHIRSNTFTEDDKKVVLQAMGLQFLTRLVKTTSLPRGCPNNLYKSIALSLLSTVCCEESVVVQSEMKSFLLVIKDIFLQSGMQDMSQNTQMQQMTSDSLDVLTHIAQYHESVQQLVTSGIFTTLLETLTSQDSSNTLKVLSLIGAIVKHCSHLFMEQSDKLTVILELAAEKMSKGSDMKEKMEYAKAATVILNHTPEVELDLDSDWVRSMADVVLKLIPVKLVPEHSEVVFYLLSALVTRVSVQVLVLDGKEKLNTIKALIARIAVEIYMLLDGIGPDNATERYSKLDQVYKLLSEMVHFICGEFGETADADTIISLYRKLVDISNTIMEFLTSISNQEVALPRNHGVVLVSVRVLSAMLTEVTEDPTPTLLKLIPFFNLLCQNIEYADDVKLEVKNVTQAALENIKMMGMQTILEAEAAADSSAKDSADSTSIYQDEPAAKPSLPQRVDDHKPPVETLHSLDLSSNSPAKCPTSNESRPLRSDDSCLDHQHQEKNAQASNLLQRKSGGKGNIHTTLFYVSEGTKGDNPNPPLTPDGDDEDNDDQDSNQGSEVIADVRLSQENIDDFFYLQRVLKEEEKAKQQSESQRIRPRSSYQRRKRSESLSKSDDTSISSEVWKLAPDDILGFLLPAYMFLMEHNETVKIMVKCDLFQTIVNFIQRSTSETLEGRSSAIPETTTINALKFISHLYECHPDVASTQLCLLDLLELFILSLPNLVSIPHPPPMTCLKMIEVCLSTLISNTGIRKRKSALHRIRHSRSRFFKAVVDYLFSFYEFKQSRKRVLTLYVKEDHKDVWETAADYWCGCVSGISDLVRTEDDLQETLVKTSFLPFFMSFLVQSNDPGLKNSPETSEKILNHILLLIECAAAASNALRGFVLQNKGILIARKYDIEKLETRLNQHV